MHPLRRAARPPRRPGGLARRRRGRVRRRAPGRLVEPTARHRTPDRGARRVAAIWDAPRGNAHHSRQGPQPGASPGRVVPSFRRSRIHRDLQKYRRARAAAEIPRRFSQCFSRLGLPIGFAGRAGRGADDHQGSRPSGGPIRTRSRLPYAGRPQSNGCQEIPRGSSPSLRVRSRIQSTISSWAASPTAMVSTMPASMSTSGARQVRPLASRKRAVSRNAARLLASGSGWLLAMCEQDGPPARAASGRPRRGRTTRTARAGRTRPVRAAGV